MNGSFQLLTAPAQQPAPVDPLTPEPAQPEQVM
jgi:hypothetical protein